MADDLVAFLLARITEDERMAREACDPRGTGEAESWRWETSGSGNPVDLTMTVGWAEDQLLDPPDNEAVSLRSIENYPALTPELGPYPATVVSSLQEMRAGPARHIAYWDPARVLAECGAKRRLVTLHAAKESYGEWYCEECSPLDLSGDPVPTWPCDTIRLLAWPYAAHPDYRPEWAPLGLDHPA